MTDYTRHSTDAFGGRDLALTGSYTERIIELRRLLPWLVSLSEGLATADKKATPHQKMCGGAFRIKNSLHILGLNTFDVRVAVADAVRYEWYNLKKAVAERAGIPERYFDDLWVSAREDGSVNIYFGGIDMPDGRSRGLYVIDKFGWVSFRLLPFGARGPHNFTRQK